MTFAFEPGTALGRAQHRTAEIYGVPFAYPSTNGTTPLNVLALLRPGDMVLIGRDAHVSLLAPLIHLGLRPVYLTPGYAPDLGVPLQITPAQLRAALDEHPDVRAVVLTYPNYFGVAGDLAGCAAVARERGVPLIVDSAHGAHLAFQPDSPDLPPPAERSGAAIVTQSQHKTCGALGQASLALINDPGLIERFYEVVNGTGFVSTSFSSVILASLFESIWRLHREGAALIAERLAMVAWAREAINRIPGLRSFDATDRRDGFAAFDPLRLTINVAASGQTGFAVERALQSCGHYPEFATLDTVLCLVTLGTAWGELRGLVRALAAVVAAPPGARARRPAPRLAAMPPQPRQLLSPREVFYSQRRRRVAVGEAVGGISAETIATYPPGSALIVAGEEVTAEVLDFLREARAQGATLKGASDPDLTTILLVDRD